jgi:hypothetical protein
MSESLNSVPLVYNPDLIKYPEKNRLLLSHQSKRLDQFIQQFLAFKNMGIITADHLDLSINASVSQSGDRIIFPLQASNYFIQKKPAIMACVNRSACWFKALSKLGMGQKILAFFDHPSNKRFSPAVLFHEELHKRLEEEALGTNVPHDFREKNGVSYEIIKKENREAGKVRIKEASRKYKAVMKALLTQGFTEDDVRKLNTLYCLFNPEEFFTTSMEAILQLKCRELEIRSTLSEAEREKAEKVKAFLENKLSDYTEQEIKLTNALKEECSKVSPAFKDMMSKIDTNWKEVFPLLLGYFKKVK